MKNLIIFILFIFSALQLPAQQRITEDELIEIAVSNHFRNRLAQTRIKKAELDSRGAAEFSKTTLFVENDDFSPSEPEGEWKVGIEQEIPWPGANRSRKEYADRILAAEQLNLKALRSEIVRDVRKSYYRLWYLSRKKLLYTQLDSLYRSLYDAANLRFSTGDVPGLDRISAEAKLSENAALLSQIGSDIEIEQSRLMLLTNSETLYLPEDRQLPKLETAVSVSAEIHPSLLVNRQEIEVSKSMVRLQKLSNHPDLSVSAFSQKLLGLPDPISGFTVGLSFPLFGLKSAKNRVMAAEQQVLLKEAEFSWKQMNLKSLRQQSLSEVEKQEIMLEFYLKSGLKDAEAILTAASLSYKSGEISFAELSSFIIQAISIRDNYLECLNLYNQSVIEYNYLSLQN